jgi:CheY-like chemotaxis protein
VANRLVIDDESLIRQMARRILERSGHRVIEAENGVIGLARLEENSVALVLTDIVMRDKEGVETIQDIRRSHPDVKVIALSGSGSHSIQQQNSALKRLSISHSFQMTYAK